MNNTIHDLQSAQAQREDPLIERIVVKICVWTLMALGVTVMAASALSVLYLMIVAPLVFAHLTMLALQGVEVSPWMGIPTMGADYVKFAACTLGGMMGWFLLFSAVRLPQGRAIHYTDTAAPIQPHN